MPNHNYEWSYEYYDDEEPVSFEGLKAHRCKCFSAALSPSLMRLILFCHLFVNYETKIKYILRYENGFLNV